MIDPSPEPDVQKILRAEENTLPVDTSSPPQPATGDSSTLETQEFPPEVIAEMRQMLADSDARWAAMSSLERARNLLAFIVWECKGKGWMIADQIVEDWLAAAEKELAEPEPEKPATSTPAPEEKYGCAPGCTYSHHGFHVAECAKGKSVAESEDPEWDAFMRRTGRFMNSGERR